MYEGSAAAAGNLKFSYSRLFPSISDRFSGGVGWRVGTGWPERRVRVGNIGQNSSRDFPYFPSFSHLE